MLDMLKQSLIEKYNRNIVFNIQSEYNDFVYEVYNNKLRILKYIGKKGEELVIPDVFDIIGSFFYENSLNLNDLIQLDMSNISILENYSFIGSNLQIVKGNFVREIGQESFSLCSDLKSLDIENVEIIHSGAFKSCQSLERINLLKLRILESYGFNECTNLRQANMPQLYFIGEWAFAGCDNLKNLPISNGAIIGEGCFRWCKKLCSTRMNVA